jgi:hypothetical protein
MMFGSCSGNATSQKLHSNNRILSMPEMANISNESGGVIMDLVYFEPDMNETAPFTALVESYLGGVGQLIFEDGTYQFAENETYPDIVYSPRLTKIEMESFCKENIQYYEQYFEDNFDAIDQGDELPPIRRFWEIG